MNCNCIEEIEKTAFDKFKGGDRYKKPVKKIEMKEVCFVMSNLTPITSTYTTLSIELEGQHKRPTVKMTHSFCPFCGEKINKS